MSPPIPAPPMDQPHYGIGFGGAISRGFKKYATFAGRASRSEYWWWTLFTILVGIVLSVPAAVIGVQTSPDGGRTPGVPAVPPAGPPRAVLPGCPGAIDRGDRAPAARRRLQRVAGAARAHPLRGCADPADLRSAAAIAGRGEVRSRSGLSAGTVPARTVFARWLSAGLASALPSGSPGTGAAPAGCRWPAGRPCSAAAAVRRSGWSPRRGTRPGRG
jgi:hypothetical protein